jgi:hypothetical protein
MSADLQEPLEPDEPAPPPQIPSLFDPRQVTPDQLPGLARIAGSAWLHSAKWAAGATGRTGRLMLRSMSGPDAIGDLVEEIAKDVSVAAGTVSRVARDVSAGASLASALTDGVETLEAGLRSRRHDGDEPDEHELLREKGQRLLRQSRDVFGDYEVHPAYARILDELAPDEARILLLLLRGGPQPAVDVRTGGPVGAVSSTLIKAGLNMVGPRAGLRYPEEVPAYLNNLFRLGLIWLSREQISDPVEYQVVEAQPDVLEAMHSVRFAKVVRRSIHLTPFGVNFCTTCLAEDTGAELPTHLDPDEDV